VGSSVAGRPPLPTRRFLIHPGPLPAEWCAPLALRSPACGALASFLGVVRDHHHGRAVAALGYECYESMALAQLARLADEAAERCAAGLAAGISVAVAHGTGAMVPGDVALAVHVASAHREAAFSACRHLVERIKQDLPVWKRERYADGTEAWLPGS
jgi:molybdopterin synthase catalytic subunit